MERDFGPTGHDYLRAGGPVDPEVCSLSQAEIDALLADRLRAKLGRDYRKADNIQHWMWDRGVRVHDRRRQWRADGISFADDDDDDDDDGGGGGGGDRRYTRGAGTGREGRGPACSRSPHSQPPLPYSLETLSSSKF